VDAAKDMLEAQIGAFLDELASEDPTPGAGAAAGIAVAMAAALCAMAARASRGTWSGAQGALAQAEALRHRATPLPAATARAYEDALVALRLRGEPASSIRDEALGDALARAAELPLAIARAGADVAELAAAIASAGDPAWRGDAIAAALLAAAGARAAANLVSVNLRVTEQDERLVAARKHADAGADAARRAETGAIS